jgi:hypothetical protein
MIKVSTNCLHKADNLSIEYVSTIYPIEYATLKTSRINKFMEFTGKAHSWHLPDVLNEEEFEHEWRDCDYYVVHPHCSGYIDFLMRKGVELHIECLDSRKLAHEYTHKGSKFLELFEKYPSAKACIDLAHVLSVTPNPKRAYQELKHLPIASFHISAFSEAKHHAKVYEDWAGWELINALANSHHFFTLETPVKNMKELEEQVQLVRRKI